MNSGTVVRRSLVCFVVSVLGCAPAGDGPSIGGADDWCAPPFECWGGVLLAEGPPLTSAVAVFVRGRVLSYGKPPVLLAAVMNCEVTEGLNEPGEVDATALDPGSIEVRGVDGNPFITFTPWSMGYLGDLAFDLEDVWEDGEELIVEASGGASFGAFAFSVSAPAQATLSAPLLEDGMMLSRADDLELVWAAPMLGDGDVKVMVHSLADNRSVVCEFPDSGDASVPAQALMYLAEGDGAIVFRRTRRAETTNMDGYPVRAELSSSIRAWVTLQ